MVSDRKNLDYSAGSGTLDETDTFVNEHGLSEADGRSEMETYFNPNDADKGVLMSDGQRRSWKQLHSHHEDHYGDDYQERKRKADVRRDASTFSETVDLTDHQKNRVMFHVDDLKINDFGQTSSEAVILALIAFVANVDDRWIQRESEFRELQDSLEISSDKVKRVTRQVQEKVGQ